MEAVRLPTKVDEPHQLLLWSADELVPLIVMFVVGVILEKVLIFLALGWLVTSLYKRYKNSRPDGFLLHALYWAGFLPTKAKTMVNPYRKRWIP